MSAPVTMECDNQRCLDHQRRRRAWLTGFARRSTRVSTRRGLGFHPSELAEEHQVDRSTVHRALGILAERHLVILTAGIGAQVPAASPTMRRAADDVTRQVGTWRGFHVSATRAGHQPFTETTVSEINSDVDVGRGLGVSTGTPVLRRARRQGILGGPPVQLSISYLRLDLVERVPVRSCAVAPGL